MPIVLKDLRKSYGRELLHSLCAEINDGEAIRLTGPSGAGKTTLLRLIMGLEKPDSGSIFGAENVLKAAVFQEDRLIEHLSGPENVFALSPHRGGRAHAENALSELLIPRQELHKPVSEWSGGMRRRAAIARAMCRGASLILMDEPFNGLDEKSRLAAADYIKKNLNGAILIYVDHSGADDPFHSREIEII